MFIDKVQISICAACLLTNIDFVYEYVIYVHGKRIFEFNSVCEGPK